MYKRRNKSVEFEEKDLENYNDYMNFIRELLNTKEIDFVESLTNQNWLVSFNKKQVEVISYHSWKIMQHREEKLNQLLDGRE